MNAPVARDVRARVRLLAVRSAEHLAKTQQLDAAADILEKYIAVHGPEAEIMRLLGGMRLKQGRAREAALLLEGALARHFECAQAQLPPSAEGDNVQAAVDSKPTDAGPPSPDGDRQAGLDLKG